MDLTSTFAPITKTVDQDDGSLLVYGKATDDSLDLDDQRCDAEWLKTAMPEWFQWGNIREQHRADSAIGKAIEHDASADGHYITARIVDPLAVVKTKAGIFTGFSIGIRKPKIVKSSTARNGLITGGLITEVSLVDRPANSNAILTLCKSAKTGWEGSGADLDLERGLVRCEELLVDEDAIAKELQVTITKGVEPKDEPPAPEPAKPPVVNINIDGRPLTAKISEAIGEANKALADAVDSHGVTVALKDGFKMPAYDRAKAIALVKALGQNEGGDIAGANSAISTIAQLIISEAQDLAKMPSQDCDIHLLMSAVDALRCFARREQMEQAAVDPDNAWLAADIDIAKGKYSAEQLRSMLAAGKAMKNPNGEPSYPIGDKEDLSNAIRAVGRGSGSHDSIRAYIKRRAKALGASDMIPDNWSSSGSNKAANSDAVAEEGKQTMTVDAAEAPVDKTLDTDTTSEVPETPEAPGVENKGVEIDAPTDDAPAPEATDTPDEDVDKSVDADTPDTPDITKGVGRDLVKQFLAALVTEGSEALDELNKALSDEDSPLHKTFRDSFLVKAMSNKSLYEEEDVRKMHVDITEASTKSAVKALSDSLGARLEKVEQMATPGGPSLRRTEVERVNARKSDLEREVMRYKTLASAAEDPDLRKGYTQKALQVDAELKAL
jgi:hypothetical protein